MNVFIHIYAIFIKQFKDSLKNRLLLVIFFMFPMLALVFKGIVSDAEFNLMMPSFMTMNTVMIPIIFMSSIVSEEKEKKTLRMLIMSGVKSLEYLVGVGMCVFLIALASTFMFLFIAPFNIDEAISFVISSIIGIALSLIIGAILAVLSKNQMSVGPITAPVSMAIGLLPMFAAMNNKIELFAKAFYSYYVRQLFITRSLTFESNSFLIILMNFVVLCLIFIVLYKKKGINNE